ncbi:hypothetical protein PoB_002711400 [Plakobranchus ocellatus]|uniref:Uncharacterized protein n=1 Tax=Plakobranchus ocellatus TaxID=259542 RepID=A0AAV4A1Z3_9GAST|nr:hypothetical protein PoB_002711400 [Plakobranchus ocellatus]
MEFGDDDNDDDDDDGAYECKTFGHQRQYGACSMRTCGSRVHPEEEEEEEKEKKEEEPEKLGEEEEEEEEEEEDKEEKEEEEEEAEEEEEEEEGVVGGARTSDRNVSAAGKAEALAQRHSQLPHPLHHLKGKSKLTKQTQGKKCRNQQQNTAHVTVITHKESLEQERTKESGRSTAAWLAWLYRQHRALAECDLQSGRSTAAWLAWLNRQHRALAECDLQSGGAGHTQRCSM